MSTLQVLTVPCKLSVDESERDRLFATLRAFAGACRHVVEQTPNKLTNETRLRAATYRQVREEFGLSSNLAQQAIARVAANRKAARHTRGEVRDYAATSVQYDERTFSLKGDVASLTILGGRGRFRLIIGEWQKAMLERHAGERRIRSAHLCARRSKGRTELYLHVHVEVVCAEPVIPEDWIGIDKGRRDIAHGSNGRAFAGNLRKTVRDRFHRVRRSLQIKASKGTRSTRRRCREALQRLSGRERRFQQAENHLIAKAFVQDAVAMRAAICLEDLTGIRSRAGVPRIMRRDHHGWSFFQLDGFIAYKSRLAGVSVEMADPRYTSKTCSCCGHLGERRGKVFSCGSCGHHADADRNAADNLRLLGLAVMQPGGPFCALPKGVGQGS